MEKEKRLVITAVNQEPEYRRMMQTLIDSIAKHNNITIGYDVIEGNYLEAQGVRAKLMLNAFKDGYDKVCWLDADMLVRGSLDELFDSCGIDGFSVKYRPECDKYAKFNTGCLVVGRECVPMIKDWEKLLRKPKGKYPDQHYLWKVYKKHKFKLYPFFPRFNDHEFKNDSIIWHAKGHHRKNPKWLKECKKYE